jgi:hypothetical protein
MNPKIFAQLKNDPAYSLSASEREAMRNQLRLRMAQTSRQVPHTSSFWFVYLMRPMPLGALALILTVSASSVSLAAGGALPGDMLYAVKTQVNEKVALALATSPEARADVRVRQLEERLVETEVLAARGALPEEVIEQAIEAVHLQVEETLENANDLVLGGDTKAAEYIHARVASTLTTHGELLTAQAQNFTDGSRESLEALSRVAYTSAEQAQAREIVEETPLLSLQAVAETAEMRAKEQMEQLRDLLAKADVPEETMYTLTNELEKLSGELEVAEGYLAQEDFLSAKVAFEEVDRQAYRADTLLQTAKDIARNTDQEVIIVLGAPETAVVASEPVALRAKSAEPEAATAMTMMMDVSTSTLLLDAPEQAEEVYVPGLQFRLRTEGAN